MPTPMTLDSRVNAVEAILGYHFTDREVLLEALRLPGALAGGRIGGNKDLAQVGGHVLHLILVLEGYDKRETRERISHVFQSVAGNSNLQVIGFSHKLNELVWKNPSQDAVPPNPMAATVEALLGAVFLDSRKNLDVAKGVMGKLGLSWPVTLS